MIQREVFFALVKGLPYRRKFLVDNLEGLRIACELEGTGSKLIVVEVNDLERGDLAQRTESLRELKELFMEDLPQVDRS